MNRLRSYRSGYRVISLCLLIFFLSPTDPVFLILFSTGIFFLMLGSSVGIKITGSVMVVVALLTFAHWNEGLFLVIYVGSASAAAGLLLLYRVELDECLLAVMASLAGCLTTASYLAASGWTEINQFEEKLGSELLKVGKGGISNGFYDFLEIDMAKFTHWLESGVKLFVHLSPGLMILMTIAAFYLATTLLRGFAGAGDSLPEQLSLAEFRFNDNLVWFLTGGLVLFLAPLPDAARRVGANIAFLMSALIMLRGLGVWMFFLQRRVASPSVKGFLVLFFFLLFPPVAAGLALTTGLADIWIDVRKLGQTKGVV